MNWNQAVLAIAAQSDHLDTIDVLYIEDSLFQANGLHLKESAGLTPYSDFKDKHMNIVELDYESLGAMAHVIIESIRKQRRKRFSRRKLKEIISEAVGDGKVNWSELRDSVRKEFPNPTPTEGAL